MQGKFITFEGPEGAGKTTVIQLLEKTLKGEGHNIMVTREPGGIKIAEDIRKVILNPQNTDMDSRTEALLYAAARRQHLAEKIIPSLKQGTVILCDRFIDSSLAYQGFARGLGIEEIYKINEFAINGVMPDITFYLDIEPEIGLSRIHKNEGREINRLDLENLEFHYKVREGYLLLLDEFPERIQLIDASQTAEEVAKEIYISIIQHLQESNG